MKKKELFFIAAILVLAAGLWGVLKLSQPERYESIRIIARGEVLGTYSLDEDQVIEINGTNVAEIRDHQILMTQASCPDQICVLQGPINEHGGLIVCLPNEVLIEGENISESSLQTDAVAS